jgi:hypothetical protein
MDFEPKTRQEKKGKNGGKKTKEIYNQKTIRIKEALFTKTYKLKT